VRRALGLTDGWRARDGIDRRAVSAVVAEQVEPRERQALGLKYLGYSDKEMARLMGVRPGVPRSYLSAGKRKLGISAGASTSLFVHFAGLVEDDALPLVDAGAATARPGSAPAPGRRRRLPGRVADARWPRRARATRR
jgi:DNA-binding CsgD family transcriptional regulator